METRKDKTVFMRLPLHLQRPIIVGCQCRYCKDHPDRTPMWDTLAGHPEQIYTWVVHYPDLPALQEDVKV